MGQGYAPGSFPAPMSIPGRAGSTGSGGYGMGGSPFGATAMPIPGSGSPYNISSGLPYDGSNIPPTGSSPYGQGYAGPMGSVPGAGMAGIGSGGMTGYGGVGGGSGSAGVLFSATTPSAGNGLTGFGITGGSPAIGGVAYPPSNGSAYGGGQAGFTSLNAAQTTYPGMYGANGATVPQQQVPYSGAQTAYGTTGYTPVQPQVQVAYPQQQSYHNAAGMPTTTIVSGGRSIPAPPGSTIVIDTSRRRPRRNSYSEHKHEGSRHRSRSFDARREQPSGYVMAAR